MNSQQAPRITVFIGPILAVGHEKNCLRREEVLPFLEMRCNIVETIYFNPHPIPLP